MKNVFKLESVLRKNIKELEPYSSARSEFKGKAEIFLDANENSFGAPFCIEEYTSLNRYPDPLQLSLKEKLGKIKGLQVENIFLGNGSDEAIDILFRAFCEPGRDNVIVCPPTYGMYEVAAGINDIFVRSVPLIPETFQLDEITIMNSVNSNTKLIFICSPNNPTGSEVAWNTVKKILESFGGMVVVDEAYINFSKSRSLIAELLNYPNLLVLQTLSKAWGLAGLRLGMAFASREVIDVFNRIKPPYNINTISQELAIKALDELARVNESIKKIVKEREALRGELTKLPFVLKVFDSEANFLLVRFKDADGLYSYLIGNGVVVRDRSKVPLCSGCLRITVGTKEENLKLITFLKQYSYE